jgi:chemosensory pili system protein ChpA (sensor histidine kinase/response regulator)
VNHHDRVSSAALPKLEFEGGDWGQLAWVLDEIKHSFAEADRATKAYAGQVEQYRGIGLTGLDSSSVRLACQGLHQVVGVLEMVGLDVSVTFVRSLQAAIQVLIDQPQRCEAHFLASIDQGSLALLSYLEKLSTGKPVSSLSLFPAYRELNAAMGLDHMHPADLWVHRWPAKLPIFPSSQSLAYTQILPIAYQESTRAELDLQIGSLLRTDQTQTARALQQLSLGLSRTEAQGWGQLFWRICAGFFQAIDMQALKPDLFVKRSLARLASQYAALSLGDASQCESLAKELLFFCAQSDAVPAQQAPWLAELRQVFQLQAEPFTDYLTHHATRVDPSDVQLASKRLSALREAWTALCAAEHREFALLPNLQQQLKDALLKVTPQAAPLMQSLGEVMAKVAASEQIPAPELAVEVATAILYLEVSLSSFDAQDASFGERAMHLADRLNNLNQGLKPPGLTDWMEDLYRQMSNKEAVGSVLSELRTSLAVLEKSLTDVFANPAATQVPTEVLLRLGQINGVLSVLGMEEGLRAVERMQALLTPTSAQALAWPLDAHMVEHLGHNVGALSLLVDMLSHQPHLVKNLFTYNSDKHELQFLVGSTPQADSTPPVLAEPEAWAHLPVLETAPAQATPPAIVAPLMPVTVEAAPLPELTVKTAALTPAPSAPATLSAQASTPVVAPAALDAEAQELLDIFLSEAHEVLGTGQSALESLENDRGNRAQVTVLRRVFHTLKGSARMVGLEDFGNAAQAIERVFNIWLADEKPISSELLGLIKQARSALAEWISHIESHQPSPWQAAAFQASADAMCLNGQWLDLHAGLGQAPESMTATAAESPAQAQMLNLPNPAALAPMSAKEIPLTPLEPAQPAALNWSAEFAGIDFGSLAALGSSPEEPREAELNVQAPARLASTAQAADLRDEVKIIGNVSVDLALYNVYLNEADEWSRLLLASLEDFRIEQEPAALSAGTNYAHSLSGSSAAVGFTALSHLCRALEHSMQVAGAGQNASIQLLWLKAAEEARRLLHQFAAGFMPELKLELVAELHATQSLLQSDVVNEPAAPLEQLAQAVSQAIAKPTTTSVAISIDEEILDFFLQEAEGLLPHMAAVMREWSAAPAQADLRAQLLRDLHTFKGGARLAGAMNLGEMAHKLESQIEYIPAQADMAGSIAALLMDLDDLDSGVKNLQAHGLAGDAMSGASVAAQAPAVLASTAAVPNEPFAAKPSVAKASGTAPTPAAPVQRAGLRFVRVQSQLLDRLLNQMGEVNISRSRMVSQAEAMRAAHAEMTQNLQRLQRQLKDLELQAESQMQTRRRVSNENTSNFDPLELDRYTRVQELTRMMAESVEDIGASQRNLQTSAQSLDTHIQTQGLQTREMQRDLLRTRMLEFDALAERLYQVVRQSAKQTEKQVSLEILGGNVEVDRSVLDRLLPLLEHMLRNSVVHGIELPVQRQAQQKPAQGQIQIELRQDGNDIVVRVQDDGGGLSLEKIQIKALQTGLLKPGQNVSEAELTDLIFSPGFSTAAEVNELAGRGVGMDVVRTEAQAMGGRVKIDHNGPQGLQFSLNLPLTTAATQVLMVKAGNLNLGVPANLVELVTRANVATLEQAYATGSYSYAGESIPFFWCGALLKDSKQSAQSLAQTPSVIVLRSTSQRVAVHIDQIIGNQEVVVKNLGPQLSRLPGLAGLTVGIEGDIVFIYNPVALANVYGVEVRAWCAGDSNADQALTSGSGTSGAQAPTTATGSSLAPLILVVDDSLTVRKVTQRVLQREGYRVAMAIDGVQALERLQEERPALVLSDIEMPRMDGFDLLRGIRQEAAFKTLPVIMITSRMAQKHRDMAEQLGANHYLGKPFAEDELLGLIKHYTARSTAA